MNIQQDRQCTYNVTLRRVRATTVALEKQQVLHILLLLLLLLISPRMLQSVRRHSSILLTVTVNGMQQIHPADISPIKARSQLIDYGLWGF